MELIFHKFQGTCNSFIIISNLSSFIKNANQLAKEICSSTEGIGADGLVLLELPSILSSTDSLLFQDSIFYKMNFYNQDGSQVEMCVNAIRCLNKYVFDNISSKQRSITFETPAGLINTFLIKNEENQALVKVKMSKPIFQSNDYKGIGNFSYKGLQFYFVSTGNPHLVAIVENFNFDYFSIAKVIQSNKKLFPNGINVEFIKIKTSTNNEIELRVIERGVGETKSCATGACASVAFLIEYLNFPNLVKVNLLGGELLVEWKNKEAIFFEGITKKIAKGTFYYNKI